MKKKIIALAAAFALVASGVGSSVQASPPVDTHAYTAPTYGGGTYVAQAVRMVDTRTGVGVPGHVAGPIHGGVTLTVGPATPPVGGGAPDYPAGTSALPGYPLGGMAGTYFDWHRYISIIVNITVTGSTSAGWLLVAPHGSNIAPDNSIINYERGQTIANSAVLASDVYGQIDIIPGLAASDSVHIIVDISGFTA